MSDRKQYNGISMSGLEKAAPAPLKYPTPSGLYFMKTVLGEKKSTEEEKDLLLLQSDIPYRKGISASSHGKESETALEMYLLMKL